MRYALKLAQRAAELGEVPVGAVLVCGGEVLGEGFNRPISDHDPTAHAEIMALRDAAKRVDNYRLPGSTLYVTLEPCSMCAGAIVHARVSELIFGAFEPKAGVAISQGCFFQSDFLNHRVEVTAGVMAGECSAMIQSFFRSRRKNV